MHQFYHILSIDVVIIFMLEYLPFSPQNHVAYLGQPYLFLVWKIRYN
jgi:hypothetical protein